MNAFDVRIYTIRRRKDRRRPYEVRWQSLHTQYVLPLDTVNATLQQNGRPNNTSAARCTRRPPVLLADFGIKASQTSPDAGILSMRSL